MLTNRIQIARAPLFGLYGLIIQLSAFAGGLHAAIPTPATSSILPVHAIRSNDCTGDLIEFSGSIHLVAQQQADGSVVGHFNYQHVVGVALGSGARYLVSAVDHFHLSAPFPSGISSVRNIHLIGQGQAANLLVQISYIIAVNADGEVTASVEDIRTQCR